MYKFGETDLHPMLAPNDGPPTSVSRGNFTCLPVMLIKHVKDRPTSQLLWFLESKGSDLFQLWHMHLDVADIHMKSPLPGIIRNFENINRTCLPQNH